MKSAAKRKVSVPTLAERVEALMQELDEALDALAEERRPKGEHGVPVTLLRRMLNARGYGDCKCASYLAAEENN